MSLSSVITDISDTDLETHLSRSRSLHHFILGRPLPGLGDGRAAELGAWMPPDQPGPQG